MADRKVGQKAPRDEGAATLLAYNLNTKAPKILAAKSLDTLKDAKDLDSAVADLVTASGGEGGGGRRRQRGGGLTKEISKVLVATLVGVEDGVQLAAMDAQLKVEAVGKDARESAEAATRSTLGTVAAYAASGTAFMYSPAILTAILKGVQKVAETAAIAPAGSVTDAAAWQGVLTAARGAMGAGAGFAVSAAGVTLGAVYLFMNPGIRQKVEAKMKDAPSAIYEIVRNGLQKKYSDMQAGKPEDVFKRHIDMLVDTGVLTKGKGGIADAVPAAEAAAAAPPAPEAAAAAPPALAPVAAPAAAASAPRRTPREEGEGEGEDEDEESAAGPEGGRRRRLTSRRLRRSSGPRRTRRSSSGRRRGNSRRRRV